MTENKPIMIDGIDVSGCKHYEAHALYDLYDCNETCEINGVIVCTKCKDNPNCYYKQLKRKEQECERLQQSENEAKEIIAELTAYKDVNEDFKTAWKELKAENNKLKKIINEAKNSKLDLQSFLVGEAVQNEYEQQLDQLKAELQEYQDWFDEFKLMFRYDDREPDDNSELYSCLEHVVDENKKLKQTLTEIKEIAEKAAKCLYATESDDYTDGYRWLGSIILQKIRKCEVEDAK